MHITCWHWSNQSGIKTNKEEQRVSGLRVTRLDEHGSILRMVLVEGTLGTLLQGMWVDPWIYSISTQ